MIHKSVCLLLMVLMMSGCCRLFGICTTVKVHSSASSPDKFADLGLYDDFGQLPSPMPQASAMPSVRPAGVIIADPHYLAPE
jgi:hypothetical protein